MMDRKKSTIFTYIFLQYWVSSYASYGGIVVNVGSGVINYFKIDIVPVAFVLSGLSVFLFFHFLLPETRWKDKGVGCEVIGCLLLAIYYKIFRITSGRKRGFFGSTEGRFKRTTISRTKEILFVYVILVPSLGVAFFNIIRARLFFMNIFERIKTEKEADGINKVIKAYGLEQFFRSVVVIGMFFSYFVIWPLLTIMGIPNTSSNKFLFGQFLAVLSFLYAAALMAFTESMQYAPGGGYVWIYNTRNDPVRFVSEDRGFTNFDFNLPSKQGELLGYTCPKPTLFAVTVIFNGSNSKFTSYLLVEQYKTTGFVVLDPPEVLRIRGNIPLRETLPGMRTGLPKVFIYNAVRTLGEMAISIKLAHKKKIIRELVTHQGILTTITLEPDRYDFSVLRADIRKIVTIEGGGLYGLLLYATTTSKGMEIFTVIGPSTASPWPSLIMCFVFGMARGLVKPALLATIFSIAPQGLRAMSFAFLVSLEGMWVWFTYVGFKTWHPYITASIMFIYACFLGTFFLASLFVLIKYRIYT